MALLEVHESKRSARIQAVWATTMAEKLDAAAQAVKQLASDQGSTDGSAATAALEALPAPEKIQQTVAELITERTRAATAREQAARMDLLD